jgi:hypothetical protein
MKDVANRMLHQCPADEMQHRLLNVYALTVLNSTAIVDEEDLDRIPVDF